MIMVCQGRNIPLLFSSIEPLFPTKSLCVAIFLCLSTLPTCAEAGEYFNPNLLEVTANSATSVDLSFFRKMAYRRVLITWMFSSMISMSVLNRSCFR